MVGAKDFVKQLTVILMICYLFFMWLLIKFSISAISFVIKLFYRGRGFSGWDSNEIEGRQMMSRKIKNKNRVVSTQVGSAVNLRSIFKFTQESGLDRWFKRMDLANEVQTGNSEFDKMIYVACDATAFRYRLEQEAEILNLILDLFKKGATTISSDGGRVIVSFSGDRAFDPMLWQQLKKLLDLLQSMDKKIVGFVYDSFLTKAFLVEGFVWALATYALAGFIEFSVRPGDLYLDGWGLIKLGLLAGLLLAGLIFLAVMRVMQGSSKAHRILIESAFVLFISIPMGGIEGVSDYNIHNDKNATVEIRAKIANKQVREHRSKGRTHYSYHIHLVEIEPRDNPYLKPREIKVERQLYDVLDPGEKIELRIRPGALKLPWIEDIIPI